MLRGLLVQSPDGVNELGAKKLKLSRRDSISGTLLQTAHESDPRRCYVAVDRVVGVLWLSVQTQGAAWGWWCSPSTCIFLLYLPSPFTPSLPPILPLVPTGGLGNRWVCSRWAWM